jgi:hypothetical protein
MIVVQFIFLAADLLEVSCLPVVAEVLVYKTKHFKQETLILEAQWPAAAVA